MKKAVKMMVVLIIGALFANTLIAQGYDNFMTPDIDEGSIGTGYDNFMTPDIDEGSIMIPDIDEGSLWSPDN